MYKSLLAVRYLPVGLRGWAGRGSSGLGGDEVGQRYIFSNQDGGLCSCHRKRGISVHFG